MKDILVHLRGTHTDLDVLSAGLNLARLFHAHMECMHIIPNALSLLSPQVASPMGTPMLDMGVLKLLEEEAKRRASMAREAFSQFAKNHGIAKADTPPGPDSVSAMWQEASGDPEARLIALARLHDLVVTSGVKEETHVGYINAGQLIIGAGRPVLLAPQSLPTKNIRTVAIAWKNTAEAARAVNASMPILSRASKIIVLCASEREGDEKEDLASCEKIATSLRWHSIAAESYQVVPGGRTVPDAIVQSAREMGVDLLVMGGYGHSRLREMIFGGFTRRILQGTELPVFIFH